MKKIAILIILVFGICSCINKKQEINKIDISQIENKKEISNFEKIKLSIERELLKDFNDPKSYEFIEMEITDSLSVKNRREGLTKEDVEIIKKNPYTSKQMIFLVDHLYDFLGKQKDENKDAVYYIVFKARGKNKIGTLVINEYDVTVLNDEFFTILMIK